MLRRARKRLESFSRSQLPLEFTWSLPTTTRVK
jgi:hypothetical protein